MSLTSNVRKRTPNLVARKFTHLVKPHLAHFPKDSLASSIPQRTQDLAASAYNSRRRSQGAPSPRAPRRYLASVALPSPSASSLYLPFRAAQWPAYAPPSRASGSLADFSPVSGSGSSSSSDFRSGASSISCSSPSSKSRSRFSSGSISSSRSRLDSLALATVPVLPYVDTSTPCGSQPKTTRESVWSSAATTSTRSVRLDARRRVVRLTRTKPISSYVVDIGGS